MHKRAIIYCSVLLFICSVDSVQAQIREVTIEYKQREQMISCEADVAGVVRKSGSFRSFLQLLKNARKQNRRKPSAKKRKQMKRFRALNRLGSMSCKALQETPVLEPDQKEGKAPADNQGQQYFSPDGTVTNLGKREFDIPDSINANAFVGQLVFERNCTGCHNKRSRPTMPLLRLAISQAPMYYDEQVMSDQDVADLTGYLNIFRTP